MQKEAQATVYLRFFVEENLTTSEIDTEVTAALEDVLGYINSDVITPDTHDVIVALIHEVPAVQLDDLNREENHFGESSSMEKHIIEELHHPNGFDSWHKTHFEIFYYLTSTVNVRGSMANQVMATSGRKGLYELSERLTNEFEAMYTGRVWEGDFFDEIGIFLEERNKEFVHTF
ncbi:hypothetical protein [Parapedobacter sp. 10938]|uniref:hypothetical protein n=1 Tax=Parapedobacter flavus TaxID=3110225 RepID=UPI002DBA0ED1|nr:hypothetical protein [Parapedobacter sp. 10938]MEC3881790.1 hypothetical protein [Parapedobacter sp. 10938]